MQHKISIPYIDRIYFGRGDDGDKFFGINVIDQGIYWIDANNITSAEDVVGTLEMLIPNYDVGYMTKGNGERVVEITFYSKRKTFIDNVHAKFTYITCHYDDFFAENKTYMKKAIRKPDGSLWWTISDLNQLLNNGWSDDSDSNK